MLQWFESDGITPLASLAFGTVGPGEDYYSKNGDTYLQVVVKNIGGSTINSVVAEVEPVSAYALNEFVKMAVGEVAPGAFVDILDPPLALGSIAPAAEVKVWFDLVVPAYAVRGRSQFASIRAYGLGA